MLCSFVRTKSFCKNDAKKPANILIFYPILYEYIQKHSHKCFLLFENSSHNFGKILVIFYKMVCIIHRNLRNYFEAQCTVKSVKIFKNECAIV